MASVLAPVACGTPVSPPHDPLVRVVRLHTEPWSLAVNTGFEERERLVIRDAAAWNAVWSLIWSRSSTPRPLPEVDFSREMLVVAAMGRRPSSGYHVLVEAASLSRGGLTVDIRTMTPCGPTLAVITTPVDVARLPRRDGEAAFRELASGC